MHSETLIPLERTLRRSSRWIPRRSSRTGAYTLTLLKQGLGRSPYQSGTGPSNRVTGRLSLHVRGRVCNSNLHTVVAKLTELSFVRYHTNIRQQHGVRRQTNVYFFPSSPNPAWHLSLSGASLRLLGSSAWTPFLRL